jgi:ribonuclease BN (tRNA processing enzyme)
VKHTQKLDCFGISISDKNKKVAYSGDTEWTHSLISLSDKADLFICECNFYDEPIEGHMNYIDLMNNEKFLSCKKVMLTHLGFKMLHKNLRHEYLYDGQIYHL